MIVSPGQGSVPESGGGPWREGMEPGEPAYRDADSSRVPGVRVDRYMFEKMTDRSAGKPCLAVRHIAGSPRLTTTTAL